MELKSVVPAGSVVAAGAGEGMEATMGAVAALAGLLSTLMVRTVAGTATASTAAAVRAMTVFSFAVAMRVVAPLMDTAI